MTEATSEWLDVETRRTCRRCALDAFAHEVALYGDGHIMVAWGCETCGTPRFDEHGLGMDLPCLRRALKQRRRFVSFAVHCVGPRE